MSLALLTDLYKLNMAAVYLRRGMLAPATFSLFVRQLPPGRGFLVAAGSCAAPGPGVAAASIASGAGTAFFLRRGGFSGAAASGGIRSPAKARTSGLIPGDRRFLPRPVFRVPFSCCERFGRPGPCWTP